jgi:hypothetical protein
MNISDMYTPIDKSQVDSSTSMLLAVWRLAALMILLLCACLATGNGQASGPTHGTVNIIVANGTDMAVVTDSMLSRGLGRDPSGIKLYQLDSTTVLTIAGLYSDPGARQVAALNASIPQIVADLLRVPPFGSAAENRNNDFTSKALSIFTIFAHELTNHFQASVAADAKFNLESLNHILFLTVAGYDLDGKLKLAEITLVPIRLDRGIEYKAVPRPLSSNPALCESSDSVTPSAFQRLPNEPIIYMSIRTIDQHFFCELVGITGTAERLLNSPGLASGNLGINRYAEAQRNQQTLNSKELKQLAFDLEQETASRQRLYKTRWVGGPVEMAVLSGGSVIEAPGYHVVSHTESTATKLHEPIYSNMTFDCNGSSQGTGMVAPDGNFQASLKGCTQPIDGLTVHDSTFTNSTVIYQGYGLLLFGHSNTVVNSILVLGLRVDINSHEVSELICTFPWTSVKQGSREIHLPCPSK